MGTSSDWKGTMGLDLSKMMGQDAERTAKKTQVIQSQKLKKQKQIEKARLMEADDELARRKSTMRMGGRQSLLGG